MSKTKKTEKGSLEFIAEKISRREKFVSTKDKKKDAYRKMSKLVNLLRQFGYKNQLHTVDSLSKKLGGITKCYVLALISELGKASKKYKTLKEYFEAGREFKPGNKVLYKGEKNDSK